MKKWVCATLLVLFVVACAPRSREYPDLTAELEAAKSSHEEGGGSEETTANVTLSLDSSYYIGDAATATVTLQSDEDLGSSVDVSVKSELDATGITVTCNKIDTNTYEGTFGFVQGASDDANDKIKVYENTDATTVSAPLFTSFQVVYGTSQASAVWWPNPFLIYYDDASGTAWQHMAYDQKGANGASLWIWNSSGGSVTEVSGGNPGNCQSININTTSDYAGFGCFFDVDQDTAADAADLSVYDGGWLQFDAKIVSEGVNDTSVILTVELEKGGGSKLTKNVTVNDTAWRTYKVYFGSGTDDETSRIYYFGATASDLQSISGVGLFTLAGGTTGEACEVYIDNIEWCK